MATAREMLDRIKSVDLTQIAGDIVEQNIVDVREKQIRQLMKGLDSEGKILSPSILDDPYFKSRKAAENYARWKKKLYPETPFGVPNLTITGLYHGSITANRSGNSIQWGATASFAGSIKNKYEEKQLGLNPESKHEVWTEIVRSPLITEISAKTGIKTK